MPDVQHLLQYTSTAGFMALGLIALGSWVRHPDPQRGYLALAVGLLGAVSLISTLTPFVPGLPGRLLQTLSLFAFMACGFALLLFRDTLIPLRRRTKLGVAAITVAVSLVTAVLFALTPQASPGPVVIVAALVLIGLWMLTVSEPVYRMWRVSRHLPAVQRARLRSLSAGYGGIVMLLVLAIVAAPAAKTPVYEFGLSLLGLAIIPVMYVAFAPPGWLRRVWRNREESALSDGIRELLLFSPDRTTLATKALHWAVRLVGADGGLVADSGEVLHSVGLVEDLQKELWAELRSGHRRVVELSGNRTAMIVPWEVDARRGGVAVVAGPFTPFLGEDEMARLEQYTTAVKAALDRVRLVESMRQSQEQLQRFNQELERRVAQRTAQLEASNQELEAFSYTVSHDLRAPLRAIDGFARILEEDERPRVTEAGQHYIDMISDNAEEMGHLIDGLLTFSRLTRQEMKRQTINPRDVVDPVVERMIADNDGRHIDFQVRELPPCRSDLMLLQQVYANLIGNAVKFSRDRDPARIEIGALTKQGDDAKTIYYVRDNGVGFDMKYADKLFGVFQRLHRAEEFEGSGAGLAIVQRIVHRHGGEVWAQSTTGEGATFYFTLGAEEQSHEAKPEPRADAGETAAAVTAEPESQDMEAGALAVGQGGS